jgi:hypothetical protein
MLTQMATLLFIPMGIAAYRIYSAYSTYNDLKRFGKASTTERIAIVAGLGFGKFGKVAAKVGLAKITKGIGNVRKTSQTFGQPIETIFGGKKVKLRVDAEPDGNKIQIQSGRGKNSVVDIRINPNLALEGQIPRNLRKSLTNAQYQDLLKNLQKAVNYLK